MHSETVFTCEQLWVNWDRYSYKFFVNCSANNNYRQSMTSSMKSTRSVILLVILFSVPVIQKSVDSVQLPLLTISRRALQMYAQMMIWEKKYSKTYQLWCKAHYWLSICQLQIIHVDQDHGEELLLWTWQILISNVHQTGQCIQAQVADLASGPILSP